MMSVHKQAIKNRPSRSVKTIEIYAVTNRVPPNGVSTTTYVGNELSAATRRQRNDP